MLKIRIVIVSNYWKGLDWFDTDQAFFGDVISGLLDTMSSPAPKDKKNMLLVLSKFKIFSPHM
jgi:hypothetical protein